MHTASGRPIAILLPARGRSELVFVVAAAEGAMFVSFSRQRGAVVATDEAASDGKADHCE